MQSRHFQQMSRHWLVAPAAFLATMLALPVNAGISIPEDPLTSAARVAPNILFILDDSGSMAWRNMNNQEIDKITGSDGFSSKWDTTGVSSGTGITSETTQSSNSSAMYMQNYVTNSLYYNPATTYLPWMGADGNRLTGGTGYTAAYSSDTFVTHAGAGTNGGSKNLASKTQTFYVPKNPASSNITYLSDVANYWRYQIVSGGGDIQKGNYGKVVSGGNYTAAGFPMSGQNAKKNKSIYYSVSIPSNASSFTVTTSGGSGDANLYVRKGSNPSTSSYDCRSDNNKNDEDCTISAPAAATYYILLYGNKDFDDVTITVSVSTTNSCDGGSVGSYGWVDCVSGLPILGRDLESEKTNFATWYSYQRTRTKAAKGGAAEAFKPLGSKVRVGFRTIWDRNNFDIPVGDGNDGRFVNNVADPDVPGNKDTTSRTTWYNRLFAATASNGTPLQSALNSAGKYFSSSDKAGPYGPESGSEQLSCRQNFSILTTDGYWNSGTVDVGNADGTSASTVYGPKGTSFTYSPTAPFKDGNSKTLADIAMKYWVTDLRTENYMGNSSHPETNNVPFSEANPAFWQHMVTFGISIGLKTAMGLTSVDDVGANPSWPTPGADSPNNIDDLLHAAVNGHGLFVAATSPTEFTKGLTKALAEIAQRIGSYSNVATNAASLRTGGQVYNASYVSGIWTGAVKSFNLDGPGGSPGSLKWTSTIPSWGSRKIYTYEGSGTTFPTPSQIGTLARSGGPVDYPVTGLENANYLKGKQDLEGSNVGDLRFRASILGDIVGSSPAYVEDTKTLYVGANDGMLHAFDATNGEEQFAYVPGIINFSNLATLSRGDYNHKFFVDGPVAVSDRKLTPGKNLLVGALGRGGKGLFFLDVSAPGSFSAAKVTKELADTPNGNMGLVLGRPMLAKVKAGNVAAAVFGNGVNSSNNKAVLIVVNLATGAVIGEIDTGVGDSTTPNGLSAPTGVVGPDGKTLAYVYAGDLLGNVWKFDVRDADPGNWTKTRLFTALRDGTGAAQPISGAVTVALDPRTFKRWVLFGTGRFLTISDANDKSASAQSMYAFVDSDAVVPYSDLQQRTIINTGVKQDGYFVRTFESKQDLPAGKKGWYVNLPAAGERIVQDAQVVSNIFVTASMMPTGDACEASGSGYINAVDAFTGTSAGKSFFDLDGDGETSDTSIGGVPVGSVNFGVGMPTLPIFLDGRLIVGGTGGDSGGGDRPGAGGIVRKVWSRVSWREIKKD